MKYVHIKSKFIKLLPFFYVIVYPLLVYLTFEILNTNSETIAKPEMLSNLPVVFISSLALFLVMMIVFSLTGNMFASGMIVTVFIGFFYVLSYYRLTLTGWVFVPSELRLISQAKDIASFADLSIYPIMYSVAVLLIIEMILLYFASLKIKMALRLRMVSLNVYLAAVLFLFATNYSKNNILPKFNIDVKNKAPVNQTYKSNGVLLGFYTSYFYAQNDKPDNFSDKAVTDLVDTVTASAKHYASDDIKPNVIVIMSEAFFDPTLLPDIAFSTDPVSNLHEIQGTATSGSVISPVFGGTTCNTEYELLTGNAMAFIGSRTIPFENEDQFLPDDDLYALPNMFKANGYKTVSVHPFKQDFFNRKSIHPKLGFDESIFLEDMVDPVIKGEFVSDEYFTDTMLDIINSTDEPLFMFGISMENHYYFDPGKFPEYDVTCESGRLDEAQLGSVNSYVQGVYDADKQLGRLLDELSKSDRPTIVLFFGDHLPLLGKSAFDVYNTLGYVDGTDINNLNNDEDYKMFSTPYIVWNNYGMKKEEWGDVSPYFLGTLVAEQAGIELNFYYEFLIQSYASFHAMKDGLFIDTNDSIFSEPTPNAMPAVENFEMLQYDRIFGKQLTDYTLKQKQIIIQ